MLCQTQIGMKKKPEINTYTIPSSNVSCTQSTTFLSESVYKNIGYIILSDYLKILQQPPCGV